jgi:hypothetical protein
MRPSTIVKALALSIGTVSAVARGLHEQRRSEIHARAAGGHGFSNALTKPEAANTNVDIVVRKATAHVPSTS